MRIALRIVEALQPEVQYNQSVQQVGKTIFGNKILRLRTKDLLPEGSKNYGYVKRALKSLRKKDITIKKENSEVYTGLIVQGEYYSNNEFVEIEISKDLFPCFLALAKNYSKYLLEVAFNASSSNVMKLYQYVSHHYWNKKMKMELDIEEIREWLQLGDKYSQSKDFRQRILEPTIKELKEKADVYFDIAREQDKKTGKWKKAAIKNGRQIIGWKINIFKKATNKEEISKATEFEQNIRNYLSEYFKLKPMDIVSLEKYIRSPEWQPHIWNAMHRVAKRIDNREVKNKRAYMIQALKNELEG